MTTATATNVLLEAYEKARTDLETAKHQLGKLQMEIEKEIAAQHGLRVDDSLHGKGLPNADENGEQIWSCTVDETHEYDKTGWTPLLELDGFSTAHLYTPEHEELVIVKAAWVNTNTVIAQAKAHPKAATIIENSKMLKTRKLKFNRINREATNGTGGE